MSDSDLTNREKLEEVYRLTVENNHMLHKIQSRDRIAIILRVVYWLVILGALGGAFYYVRFFFGELVSGNSQAAGMFQQFENLRSQFPETKAIQQFMEQFEPSGTEQVTEQG
jgi:hypothetical protein